MLVVFEFSERSSWARIGPFLPENLKVTDDYNYIGSLFRELRHPPNSSLTTVPVHIRHLPPSATLRNTFSTKMPGKPAPEEPPFPWRSDMLEGKYAIVTGGSAGIGASITECLVSVVR